MCINLEEDGCVQEWDKFVDGKWKKTIDVEDFILTNYKEYNGTSEFLVDSSKKTNRLWNKCLKLIDKESITNIVNAETSFFSGIDSFDIGYIDKKNEVIVGLQTDEPLKVFANPYISLRSCAEFLRNNGYRLDKENVESFYEYNYPYDEILEETYTSDIKKYKKNYLFGNLPEIYNRGFIVGDYRRIALYGVDYLLTRKYFDLERLKKDINYSMVRTREEVVKQIHALKELKIMAARYGFNIGKPAKNAKEAVQWIYFAYLSVVKQNNGVSIPTGNNSTFLDIYIERDINNGVLTESGAQELIDQFVIKLRMVRMIHCSLFNDYYYGKTNIITETIGGIYNNKSLITKTAYRFINTFDNLGLYTVPNICILWSKLLPISFKKYCSRMMVKYNVLHFINIDNIKITDIAVTGVSGLSKIGKQIDYFGGNINLPKILLYAINEGKDELTGEKIIEGIPKLKNDTLDYKEIITNYISVLKNVINKLSDSVNTVHYLQDKYAYESAIMAFNGTVVERYITFDLSGLSVLVDSLSAIRYSNVVVKRDENGISTDFTSNSKFPRFGINDNNVDSIAVEIVKLFNKIINEHKYYRNAKPKIGINSFGTDIVFGKNTGATPDGRFSTAFFSNGVNPTSKVDSVGVLDSLNSVLKIPSEYCLNGIVNTLNINKELFGSKNSESSDNLIKFIDKFFAENGSQIEINIIDKNTLHEALSKDELARDIFIRNSGYIIRFSELNEEQKNNILDSTYHKGL